MLPYHVFLSSILSNNVTALERKVLNTTILEHCVIYCFSKTRASHALSTSTIRYSFVLGTSLRFHLYLISPMVSWNLGMGTIYRFEIVEIALQNYPLYQMLFISLLIEILYSHLNNYAGSSYF